VPIDPEKIAAIVVTDEKDSASTIEPQDADTSAIASHLIRFFEDEVEKGRLDLTLQPLQAGYRHNCQLRADRSCRWAVPSPAHV
jgi:succinyl-CoA:acetate CoA-transferase